MEGKHVHFTNGESIEVDHVVFCTGYHIDVPFLSDEIKQTVLDEGSNSIKVSHYISYENMTSKTTCICMIKLQIAYINFDVKIDFLWAVSNIWGKKITTNKLNHFGWQNEAQILVLYQLTSFYKGMHLFCSLHKCEGQIVV